MLAYNNRLSHIGWNPKNGALTQPFRDALFQHVTLADEHELIPMTEYQRQFFEHCCASRLTHLNGLLQPGSAPLTLGDPARLSDITLPAIAFEGIAKAAAEIVTNGLSANPADRHQIALDLAPLIRSSLS